MSRPEPSLVFAIDYTDDRKDRQGEVWPGVCWMWAAPRIGDVVDVEVAYKRDGGGLAHRAERCKVVAVAFFSYGSEGVREYAGSLTLRGAP